MDKRLAILWLLLVLGASPFLGVVLAQENPAPAEPQEDPQQDDSQEQEAGQEPQAETPVPQPPAPAAIPVTLGDFVMQVAAGMKLQAPRGGFTPESAAWALVLKGIKVRPELTSPLTEGDAVLVLTGMGYRIRTATPSRVMTSDRVTMVVETLIPPGKP